MTERIKRMSAGALAVALVLVMVPGAAVAQSNDAEEARVQRITMDAAYIEGDQAMPAAQKMDAHIRTTFEKLHELKRSVMPKLIET